MTDQTSLAAALAALQAQLPRVGKDATNPHFKSKYATLEAISAALLPLLAGVGLSFSAKPTLKDGAFVLQYTLRHVSGESDTGLYPLPSGNPQQIGSAITYARRYSLCAVTGLAPDDDDDDGNEASGSEPRRTSRSVTPARQKAARTPDPARGQTPTDQREDRARRAADSAGPRNPAAARSTALGRAAEQERVIAQTIGLGHGGGERTRAPLPDQDNVWQGDADPRPATVDQKNAIRARLEDMGRPVPDMSGFGYLEAARMITDLADAPGSAWQEADPEDRPGTALPGQKRAIEALLTKAGCATGKDEAARDERHAVVLKYLPGLEALKSMNHLSFNEAAAAIRGLSADTGDEKMPQAVPDHAQRAANDWPEDPWAGDAPDWTRS